MSTRARHALWRTAALALLVPALLTGLVLTAVNRVDAVLADWGDDFHDWAYQGEKS